MKGIITLAIKEMVTERCGVEKWSAAALKANLSEFPEISFNSDLDDATVLKLLDSLQQILQVSGRLLADMIGEYWVTVFARREFPEFFTNALCSEDFLVNLNYLHQRVTQDMENASPPTFQYDWRHDGRLMMFYSSQRGLIQLAIGLVRGIGEYFGEELQVVKHGEDKIEILFPPKP